MARFPDWIYRQSAVLPYRLRDGDPEVLLITSRGGRRWVLPKGIVEPGMTAPASAAKEAREEAGIEGRVSKRCLGSYRQDKWGGTCRIKVFPMKVTAEFADWPEAAIRRRAWLPLRAAIERLYPDAFPDEDLLPLVRELLRETPIVLSLVGIIARSLAGHAVFTTCGTTAGSDKVALLGPLAVAPAWQRQGIGTAMVRAGLQRLENAGVTQVYVLGDPAYYGRLGFVPEAGVTPPYPLPEEWRGAWQSMSLGGAAPPSRGKLTVPPPWRRAKLWAP